MLLHGVKDTEFEIYLKDEGVMAIILPHGVLFRGGAEERIPPSCSRTGASTR
jgi:hypothetical protein